MPLNPISVIASSVVLFSFATHMDKAKAIDNDKRDPAVHEAQAARQEERQGKLKDNADEAQRERNKFARCEYLKGDDREYCIRRMNGEGTVTGSVEGGGLYRELRVYVPAEKLQ